MALSKLLFGAALAAMSAPELPAAIQLQRETVNAWEHYIRDADHRTQSRVGPGQTFLWADETRDRRLRLRHGEVLVAPAVKHGTQSVPGGLIHHWIGAVFIPGGTIERLWSVVHDYDRYKEIYKPAVTESKALQCSAEDQEFSMIWQRRIMFVNAAIEGRYRAHDFIVGDGRGYNIADTVRVQEIEEYGHAGERFLPPGTGSGFMWRLHSIARYQERDGGVYLELEAIALTREIPASLRWLASPVVNRLSIDSMTMTLRETRTAVGALAAEPVQPSGCGGRNRAAL